MALKRLALGATCLSAARAAQTLLSFLALPVLARLLEPSEFGLVALAAAFVLFTMAFSDAGMGQSLVHTPPEQTLVWSTAFWMIAFLSGGLSLLLLAMAWPAAWLFNQPHLSALICGLAPLPMVQGMLAPATAELQQREKFTLLAFAEVSGALAGVVAAVSVALSGGGAWALVVQQLAVWAVKAVILICATQFRPRFQMNFAGLAPHFRFGRDTAGWSLVNFFARQIDPLAIAKVLGTTALGLYSVSYRLMSLPAYLVSGPIQNTLYTRMVQLREDTDALRALILIMSRAMAAFIFPPMAVLCAASPAIVHLVLSERWIPAAPLFSILAPVGALQAVTALNGALLMAIGRTDVRLRLTFEFTMIWVVAAPLLAMVSLTAVAIGYTTIFIAYLPRMLHLFLRPINASIGDYIDAISVPLLIAGGLLAGHLAFKMIVPLPPPIEIAVAITEILAGYGVAACILRGRLRADLLTIRRMFSSATLPDPATGDTVALQG